MYAHARRLQWSRRKRSKNLRTGEEENKIQRQNGKCRVEEIDGMN
jgi:hypothetical protein